jgi:hypothetical protein
MSVYLDPLAECVPTKIWPWHHSAHLFADTAAELHTFAARLGLKPAWFQDDDYFPHYDLTAHKQTAAITAGALPLSRAEAVAKWHEILHRGFTSWKPTSKQ